MGADTCLIPKHYRPDSPIKGPGPVGPSSVKPGDLKALARGPSPLADLTLCFFDEFGRIADGCDLFSRIVWDFHAKLFFESHYQLNDVEAVCAQIIDEA